MPRLNKWVHIAFLSLLIAACAPLSAPYSLQAYTNATSLKAETLRLVEKSGEPYDSHTQDIDALLTKMSGAYEFSHGTAHNQEAATEWSILQGNNLMGEFLNLWKSKGRTSDYYRAKKKQNFSEAFDYLICLEANKEKASSCAALKTANASSPAADPDPTSTPQ